MFGKLAVVLAMGVSVTTLAVAAEPATAPQPETAVTAGSYECLTGYRERVRTTYRYSHTAGAYNVRSVRERGQKRLLQTRRCVRHRLDDDKRANRMLRYARYRRAKYRAHRFLDRITVYGKYAIPGYIVGNESGGDPCAKNPESTAGGYYQFIDSTWYAMMARLTTKMKRKLRRVGWTGRTTYYNYSPAKCAHRGLQHVAGYIAWNHGNNNHWALTR